MSSNNAIHPADNYMMTQWTKLDNVDIFNQTAFGVYALTEPTDGIPPNDMLPHMYEKTIYFGKSGSSYDDYFYDRKRFDEDTNKETFYRYTPLSKRLKGHRSNIVRSNPQKEREASYEVFSEKFGCGEDIMRKVNVCVLVPRFKIPNYCVNAWALALESHLIFMYQLNYGKNTLMNLNHNPAKKIENSHSTRYRNNMSPSLLEFV